MRFLWILAALGFLGVSPAFSSDDPYTLGPASGLPWYKPEHVVRGKVPYVAVYRYDLFRFGQENPEARIPYEWHLPLSTLEATRSVALSLINVWQRLEERTYWHVLARINYQAGFSEARCEALDSLVHLYADIFRAGKPEVSVGVAPEHLPAGFKPPLPFRSAAADGNFRMERYTYYYVGGTGIRSVEYCDGLGAGDSPIYPYVPGFCVKIFGQRVFCTPRYPEPFYIDMEEFKGRARRGMTHAAVNYIPDYERGVVNAVLPRGDLTGFARALAQGRVQDPEIFAPADWSGALLGLGAVVAPVIRLVELPDVKGDLEAIWDTIRSARYDDDELNRVKELYFAPSFKGLLSRIGLAGAVPLPQVAEVARVQALDLLKGPKYRSEVSRGIWPLEEVKRWFPPSRPEVHEALGYTTYFQVFGKMDFTILPDPRARWGGLAERASVIFLRSLHIWNVPLIFDYDGPTGIRIIPIVYPDVFNIYPIFIPPYMIFYSGPRYYYDWVSVPEGYPIPRVKGTPTGLPFFR
jgi:hypothetical protein